MSHRRGVGRTRYAGRADNNFNPTPPLPYRNDGRASNDCWFDPNVVATAFKKRRLSRHTVNAVFEAMMSVMSADSDDAVPLFQSLAPIPAARIEELLGDADGVDLDRAVRTYAAYVAGLMFCSTGRSGHR